MRKKKETKPVDSKTLEQIGDIIRIASICKNAYFWRNNGSVYTRLQREQKYNRDEITWEDGEDQYSAQYYFYQTVSHTYARGIYYRNNIKTTLTDFNTRAPTCAKFFVTTIQMIYFSIHAHVRARGSLKSNYRLCRKFSIHAHVRARSDML